jgi:hypothetical protein
LNRGVAADGNDGGHAQAKDEHGQQQHAAAQTRQPDQRSHDEADQHFEQQNPCRLSMSVSSASVLSKAKSG